jgi:hypothetical protein
MHTQLKSAQISRHAPGSSFDQRIHDKPNDTLDSDNMIRYNLLRKRIEDVLVNEWWTIRLEWEQMRTAQYENLSKR